MIINTLIMILNDNQHINKENTYNNVKQSEEDKNSSIKQKNNNETNSIKMNNNSDIDFNYKRYNCRLIIIYVFNYKQGFLW